MTYTPFGQVRSFEGLGANLGCSAADLEEIGTSADQRQFYTKLEIPKKGRRRGQFRTIHRPDQRLGLIQKNLSRWITNLSDFDSCVQGFVPRRSIATNAARHLGARLILHADIRDFFDAIRIAAVDEAFRTLGCIAPIAQRLATISTLNGQLPQGSSSSPAIANLVCRRLDADLQVLARGNGWQYSRYADDITISGDSVPADDAVSAILAAHGFALRDGRCRVQRRGRTQYVTGLTVADTARPRVPRVQKRRLRLVLYYAERFGLADHLQRTRSETAVEAELARLNGWISFLHSVEGPNRLAERWRIVAARERREVDQEPPSPETIDS